MEGRSPVIWDKEHKLWFARPGADLSLLDRWRPRPHEISTDAADPVSEFAQKLEEAGLVLNELPVMDGKIHRVSTTEDRKGEKVVHTKPFWTDALLAGIGITAATITVPPNGYFPAVNKPIHRQSFT